MRFLQALEKAKLRDESVKDQSGIHQRSEEFADGNGGLLPEVLATQRLGIGGPTSVLRTKNVEIPNNLPNESLIGDLLSNTRESLGFDLSSVPEVTVNPLSADPHAVSITQPQSIYCEEYRRLRTHLLRHSKLETLQTIVIASVGVGEGKSITALNLSWLLAQTEGVSALLVDCDLRRPSMAGYFGLKVSEGLSDVLDGKRQLTESIIKLEPSGLFLLAGGKPRMDVAELISGSMFPDILEEARSIFDYVIIDAPPLSIFTDAAVLINQADGALMVMQANQTNYKDVDRVLESIPKERVLGVVLNKSDESLIKDGYYGYSDYASVAS
ncbi:MAG: CpsD/CapB family tyrosine-protein kinase [Pyrinomonadaceae bacterium]